MAAIKDPLKKLVALLDPPRAPVEVPGARDWSAVECFLGTSLPADYKRFVATYGTGLISDHLQVMNPFSTVRPWFQRLRGDLGALHAARWNQQSSGEALNNVPYPIFPEAKGLLPWGFTYNGDLLCWRTDRHPDTWTVVAATRSWRYAEYAGTMSEFLVDLLSEKVSWSIWDAGAHEAPSRPTFTPTALQTET